MSTITDTMRLGISLNKESSPLRASKNIPASRAPKAEALPAQAFSDAAAQKNKAKSADRLRDAELVARVRSGDMLAFRRLVEFHQERARHVAFGVLGSVEDAEDVVQEAFVKAYRNLDSFRGQSAFYTWFYRIVHNLAVDFSRKKYRRVESPSGDAMALDMFTRPLQEVAGRSMGATISPDEHLDRKQLGVEISQALDSLSPDHRTVVMLREIDGLSYTEIADVVGVTKGTVMSRLHHARKKLQKVLSRFVKEERDTYGIQGGIDEDAESEVAPHGARIDTTVVRSS